MEQIEELFTEIKKQYDRELFTVAELLDILTRMGCKRAEARAIILKALNLGVTGRVSRRKRSVLPRPHSIIALLPSFPVYYSKKTENYGTIHERKIR